MPEIQDERPGHFTCRGVSGTYPLAVAYFSMEMALHPAIPTYAGGLGVLAGDTVRAAADRGAPMVAVSLLYRKGHFRQQLDLEGNQTEEAEQWRPEDLLEEPAERARITLREREVHIRPWKYVVEGMQGRCVTVLLLDTDLEENAEDDRRLSDHLYMGDDHDRLCQEAVLGLGGIAILRALGATPSLYHLNEGHSALLVMGLLEEKFGGPVPDALDDGVLESVRSQCVFTTHTPVPAGHDKFGKDLVRTVLGDRRTELAEAMGCLRDGELNMTYMALRLSRHVNGVALRHEEVSESMFPGYPIHCVTNGVHAPTWVSAPFCELFDGHIPYWRDDNQFLRYATGIPLDEIRQAHMDTKRELLAEVERRTGQALDPDALTIGFARRATEYKRPDFFFGDIERLRGMAQEVGALQVLYAGKAHPSDEGGKEMIREVFRAARDLGESVPVVYLEDYDVALAKHLCAGVDLWLNTPLPPHEASGTSGMKAALNGVPSLSVLDGWWLEGHIESVTGWSIGDNPDESGYPSGDQAGMYDKLESVILPLYHDDPDGWAVVMRSAIALNGSFFNAQRMLSQYMAGAYRTATDDAEGAGCRD